MAKWGIRLVKTPTEARMTLLGRVWFRRAEQRFGDSLPLNPRNSPRHTKNVFGRGGDHTWPLD